MTAPAPLLRCCSFHSVKGGVGKSTLALLRALDRAGESGASPVTLVDMDLTGTSLPDVLPLIAPSWNGDAEKLLLLEKGPDSYLPDIATTRERIELRPGYAREGRKSNPYSSAYGVPYLNDFFRFATEDWEGPDVKIRSLLWKWADEKTQPAPDVTEPAADPSGSDSIDSQFGRPPIVLARASAAVPATNQEPFEALLQAEKDHLLERLRVIPSSALPHDLDEILPMVFDELHAGFLESRLELLLNGLAEPLAPGETADVIFDTPPTIPGLSRVMLSLGLRLGKEPKEPLAQDDSGVPTFLKQTRIEWTTYLVATEDAQDLRALDRWLRLYPPDRQKDVFVLLNRVPASDEAQAKDLRDQRTKGLSALLQQALPISNDARHHFFVAGGMQPLNRLREPIKWPR